MKLNELVGFQRAEFRVANTRRTWLLLLQVLVTVTAAGSVFTDDHTLLLLLAIAAVVLTVLWLLSSLSYESHRTAAERARRATLILGGLGESISPSELELLRESIEVGEDFARGFQAPDYFASSAGLGWTRLLQMVNESAFWTRRLHRASAIASSAAFGIILVLLVLMVILTVPADSAEARITASRLVLAGILLLLSTDVVGTVIGHLRASSEVKEIDLRIRKAVESGSVGDALILLMDYNSAVERAPVVLPVVYDALKGKLNQEWRRYRRNIIEESK